MDCNNADSQVHLLAAQWQVWWPIRGCGEVMPLCPGVGENVENVISSILIHLLLHTGHQTQGHLSRHRSAAILDIFKIRNGNKTKSNKNQWGCPRKQKQVTLVTKFGDTPLHFTWKIVTAIPNVLTETRIENILDTPRILSRYRHWQKEADFKSMSRLP